MAPAFEPEGASPKIAWNLPHIDRFGPTPNGGPPIERAAGDSPCKVALFGSWACAGPSATGPASRKATSEAIVRILSDAIERFLSGRVLSVNVLTDSMLLTLRIQFDRKHSYRL